MSFLSLKQQQLPLSPLQCDGSSVRDTHACHTPHTPALSGCSWMSVRPTDSRRDQAKNGTVLLRATPDDDDGKIGLAAQRRPLQDGRPWTDWPGHRLLVVLCPAVWPLVTYSA